VLPAINPDYFRVQSIWANTKYQKIGCIWASSIKQKSKKEIPCVFHAEARIWKKIFKVYSTFFLKKIIV
jgi:hypothetical protein